MKFFLLFLCVTIVIRVGAQTPKSIENDLVKAYKRLPYWAIRTEYDSLEKANEVLGLKLRKYTLKYPSTITYPFYELSKDLDILQSDDGLFKTYSWDMLTGGTTHFFSNIFQYKVGTRTVSILDRPEADGDNKPNYYRLYTFKANDHTYYLAVWLTIGSTQMGSNGIKVFTIDNGKLIDTVKLIKTKSGLRNQLFYNYQNGWNKEFDIKFDQADKTIKLPLLSADSRLTSKSITYKYNGQYFEKIR